MYPNLENTAKLATSPMAKRESLGNLDDLLDLLEQECTAQQIAGLLRDSKDAIEDKNQKREVRVTADNKVELIQTNLRRAIAEKLIKPEAAWNLLREAEENGSQHIFYYVPKKIAMKSFADHAAIRRGLLSEHGLSADAIPRVAKMSAKYLLADFRADEGNSDGSLRWVAKFYGSETYRQRAGNERHERDLILVPYKMVKSRTVLIALYRGWGVLELRVPRIDSAPLIALMLDKLWEMIGPTINPDDFAEWDLTRAKRRILEERAKHYKMYTIGTTLLGDGAGGTALISPHGEDDDLFAAKARERAVDAYLGDHGACRNLRVIWHEQEQREPKTERVTTVMGSTRKAAPPNEVIVTGRVSAGTMDYVAHRLREFQS